MPFLVVLQLYNLSQAEQSHWDNFKFHTDFDAGEKNEREKRPADRFLSPFFQFVVTSHPLSSFQSPATASRAATWSSAASSRPTPRSSPGSSTCESQPRARAPCPCPALCCTLLLAQQTVAAVVRRLHTALASVRTLAAANAFCIRRPLRPRSHTSRLRPQGAGFPFKVEVSLTIEYSFNAQVRALWGAHRGAHRGAAPASRGQTDGQTDGPHAEPRTRGPQDYDRYRYARSSALRAFAAAAAASGLTFAGVPVGTVSFGADSKLVNKMHAK